MPSLVATTYTPARKPFVRTHYVRTNVLNMHQNGGLLSYSDSFSGAVKIILKRFQVYFVIKITISGGHALRFRCQLTFQAQDPELQLKCISSLFSPEVAT